MIDAGHVDRDRCRVGKVRRAVVGDFDGERILARCLVVQPRVVGHGDLAGGAVDGKHAGVVAGGDRVDERLGRAVRIGGGDRADRCADRGVFGHREGGVSQKRRLVHVGHVDRDRCRVGKVRRAVVGDFDGERILARCLVVQPRVVGHGDLAGGAVDGKHAGVVAGGDRVDERLGRAVRIGGGDRADRCADRGVFGHREGGVGRLGRLVGGRGAGGDRYGVLADRAVLARAGGDDRVVAGGQARRDRCPVAGRWIGRGDDRAGGGPQLEC